MDKTIRKFREISATLAELNAAGLHAHTVDDLLTMYFGAANQHVLRMSFVLEHHASTFDTDVGFWSHLIKRDATSVVQRHAAASWRAWQSVLPTLMSATQSPDADTLFTPRHSSAPNLCNYKPTVSPQMTKPAILKPLGPALRTNTTHKRLVTSIQKHLHKQLIESHTTSPISRAIFISQSAQHNGAHVHGQEAHVTTPCSP